MARVVTMVIVLVGIVLLASQLIPDKDKEPAQPVSPPEVSQDPTIEAREKTSLLGELQVLAFERSLVLRSCANAGDEKSDAEKIAELEQLQQQVFSALQASTEAEHLLAMASINWRGRREDSLQLVAKAAALDPRDPLIAARLLELCKEVDTCGRARAEAERNLIAADKANGLAWVQVARSRLQRNDETGALEAMQQAVAAAEVNNHFVEYVLLFDRALAASTGMAPNERMMAAMSFGAGAFSDYYMISKDCEEHALQSAEWLNLCLRLGERFEQDGKTFLTQAIGLGMQAQMLELGGDSREFEAVNLRKERHERDMHALSERTWRAEELGDATVFRRYVEAFSTAGERAAMEYLAEVVEERLPPLGEGEQADCPSP